MHARSPSASKSPITGASTASASSSSPRAIRIRASATAASTRAGSIASASRSDGSSPAAASRSAALGVSASKKDCTAPRGWAPTNSEWSAPSRKALTAGIPWMPKACARRGFASTSTFASTTSPSRWAAASSSSGVRLRQGPHQAAQKSTTTGVLAERSRTSLSKSASPTSITVTTCKLPDCARHPCVTRTLEHEGQTIAYEEHGDGPLVVALHGLTATRRYVLMGSHTLERSGRRRVLLYDARGHGASAPAAGGDYSYAAQAGDLAALVEASGAPDALLIGASMGAHTALRFALGAPVRVRGLVLVTPAYDPDRSEVDMAEWDALARGLREGGVDGFIAAYRLDSVPAAWRETVERVIRQRLAAHEHPQAVADALAAVPRSRPFDAWSSLAALEIPTLVVGSSDDADPGHPLAIARAYADAIPGARLVVEEPGRPPIAWQGGQLTNLLLDF